MRKLQAKSALLPDGWAHNVSIEIDANGQLANVTPDSTLDATARTINTLLPAPSNLHSHAFQRALAGLTEVRGPGDDDFWSWRERMYAFLPRLTPDDVETIAAQLFVELAESGFAAIAEFHYLHHQADGRAYDDVAEMAGRISAAAGQTGFGLTLLPVAYARSGFGGAPTHQGQIRFSNSAERFLDLWEASKPHLKRADDNLGIAPHSLRAVTPEDLSTVLGARQDGPIHIHAAEQVKEVVDCLDWSGQRPVEWLLDHHHINESWCFIHATQMTPDETAALARTGAVAGLCPTTEADLGDGIFNGRQWHAENGHWGIGTDSHIGTDIAVELRQLEWSQRLAHRQRTVLTHPMQSNARTLYAAALAGSAQALGRTSGKIATGYWADMVSLNTDHPVLTGKAEDALLDSWIFAGSRDCVSDVWSAGRHIVKDGQHRERGNIGRRYAAVMKRLLA
jgi:formimidoylglutamate deiminase